MCQKFDILVLQVDAGWVVGYGMDQHAYFRNLPYIGVARTYL